MLPKFAFYRVKWDLLFVLNLSLSDFKGYPLILPFHDSAEQSILPLTLFFIAIDSSPSWSFSLNIFFSGWHQVSLHGIAFPQLLPLSHSASPSPHLF